MEYTEEVSHAEAYCEHQTRSQLKILLFLEEIENFYYNLLQKQIKDKTDIRTHELAIILIHAKIIKALNCNSNFLKKGHYSEFRSLLRDIFELTFLSRYLILNPEKGESWLNGDPVRFRHVANALNLPTEIRDMYGML